MPERTMERLATVAKKKLKKAKNIWAKVKGPAAAMVASCRRLGWTVISSTEILTDQGITLDLHRDSPAAVKNEVARAVKRWRWRNLEVLMPQLKKGGSGVGALMEPITKLLKSKENSETWNPALRGSLKSAIAGRQYPQSRVFAAGWATHNKCIFCLHNLVNLGASMVRRTRIRGKTKSGDNKKLDKVRYKVEATAEQIKEAPVGNLGHRIWRCTAEHMSKLREKWAPPSDLVTTSRCEVDGHPAWERALQPRPTKPMVSIAADESFRWVVEPPGGIIEGTAYSDGSLLDGPIYELARCGWAFAVLDDYGKIVASAYGVPPPWIRDIGGAEAWAVRQVGLRALPGKIKFMIDCQPCVDMIHGGVTAATAADKPLARVNGMVMSVLEEVPNDKVVWMPAHKTKQCVGKARCGNGELLTEKDIAGNAEADRLAKLAVEQHRVDSGEVDHWRRLCEQTRATAMWIARATWAANNCEEPPFRDTEASQWRADLSRKEIRAKKAAAAAELALNPLAKGPLNLHGHDPIQVLQLSGIRSGWRCSICRKNSSSKKLLVHRRCTGCPIEKWSKVSNDDDDDDEAPPLKPVQKHVRMKSGNVIWCSRCGVYADKKSKGLSSICEGRPPRQRHRGGMEGQLRKLRNNIHPKTLQWLPPAVAIDAIPKMVKDDANKDLPEGFYTYVAAEPPPPIPSDPHAAAIRRDEFLNRIRIKEAANQVVVDARVKRTSMTCRGKYRIIVKGAACHGRACCEGT